MLFDNIEVPAVKTIDKIMASYESTVIHLVGVFNPPKEIRLEVDVLLTQLMESHFEWRSNMPNATRDPVEVEIMSQAIELITKDDRGSRVCVGRIFAAKGEL